MDRWLYPCTAVRDKSGLSISLHNLLRYCPREFVGWEGSLGPPPVRPWSSQLGDVLRCKRTWLLAAWLTPECKYGMYFVTKSSIYLGRASFAGMSRDVSGQ